MAKQNETLLETGLARKEVIISAGVIGSPAILLRSGVGPISVLRNSKIPVIKDLPVGKNLQDHPYVPLDFLVRNATDVFLPERDLNANTWRLYNEVGDGPYSTQHADTAQAFLTSSYAISSPDLHLLIGWSRGTGGGISQSDGGSGGLRPGEVPVFCLCIFTQPRSRSSITLSTTNANEDPVVDFRYLEDPRDMSALAEGIKRALSIFEGATPYQKLGARYSPTPLPACQHLSFRSDEYWKCFIRQTGSLAYHAGGSCKMGAVSSPNTVVDTQLQLLGISGLRVVDASVLPVVTNANTQAPVYAIAEKASEMILKKWDNFIHRKM